MDTDSVIYISASGEPLIPIDHTNTLGLRTNENKDANPFIEFVSSGPKSYGIHSWANYSIIKSKGFCLNHAKHHIVRFDALKEQVNSRTRKNAIKNLAVHKGRHSWPENIFP